MEQIAEREQLRLAQQASLDAGRTQTERNRLGQFATPVVLARAILYQAATLLPPHRPVRFLDPAIGTGSFYSALLAEFPEGQIKAALAFEADREYAEACRTVWADTALQLRVENFCEAKPPSTEDDCFNLVICNPPYVRHHHLSLIEKKRLQSLARNAAGVSIGGLAGLYCYFLALAHPWMSQDAIAGWLIPSEFMDVNYGAQVKQYLLTQVTLLQIHRFDPNHVQFDDALVSSSVVWFRNQRPDKNHRVRFTFGGSLAEPELVSEVPISVLLKERKWTRFPSKGARTRTHGPLLGDLFVVRRGIATGANGFFILTREEIEKKGLPWQFFRPILPSPRYLSSDEIDTDSTGNPCRYPQLFVLDCRVPEEEIQRSFPALWKYLNEGKLTVSSRYLCRHRDPWYSQEDRAPAPFLCTYMGRNNGRNGRPFRFILNHSKAIAPNVYLLLYPKSLLQGAITREPKLLHQVWEMLNRIDISYLLQEGRVYGGGLYKLEPKELAKVPVEELAGLIETEWAISVQQDLFSDRSNRDSSVSNDVS